MMRPEVRVIETQQEEIKNPNIDSWEKEQLLRKYGYSNFKQEPQPQVFDPTRDLSYEEMIRQEDRRIELERQQNFQTHTRPTVYTIDQDRVNYNEVRWSNMDLNGVEFGVEVNIVSDMRIRGF